MKPHSIHDREVIHAILDAQLVTHGAILARDTAHRACDNKYRRQFHGVSKYSPHQGAQEIARRAARQARRS